MQTNFHYAILYIFKWLNIEVNHDLFFICHLTSIRPWTRLCTMVDTMVTQPPRPLRATIHRQIWDQDAFTSLRTNTKDRVLPLPRKTKIRNSQIAKKAYRMPLTFLPLKYALCLFCEHLRIFAIDVECLFLYRKRMSPFTCYCKEYKTGCYQWASTVRND